jgi:two-component system chemotaxis response regulator CheY
MSFYRKFGDFMQSPLNGLALDIPILVVDDFSTMRRILKNCLSELGFMNISEADDGLNAIEKLRENDFKLIISDWKMPNMMGIDLLKAVRADEKYKSIPFVMVTAEGGKESMTEAINAGVSDYVVKPLCRETLGKKIEAAFAGK